MAVHKSTAKQHHDRAKRAALAHAAEMPRTRSDLDGFLRSLTLAMNVVIVCEGALREQNAELDREVAEVLRRCAGDRLCAAIEGLEGMKIAVRRPGA